MIRLKLLNKKILNKSQVLDSGRKKKRIIKRYYLKKKIRIIPNIITKKYDLEPNSVDNGLTC